MTAPISPRFVFGPRRRVPSPRRKTGFARAPLLTAEPGAIKTIATDLAWGTRLWNRRTGRGPRAWPRRSSSSWPRTTVITMAPEKGSFWPLVGSITKPKILSQRGSGEGPDGPSKGRRRSWPVIRLRLPRTRRESRQEPFTSPGTRSPWQRRPSTIRPLKRVKRPWLRVTGVSL